jgi:hypothetical protein
MWESVWNGDGTARLADNQLGFDGTVNASTDVVALPSGGFLVNYVDNGWTAPRPPTPNEDITTARFNANGVFQFHDRDTVNTNDDFDPKGAASADGYQLVASADNGSSDNYGTLISPNGTVLVQAGALDAGTGVQFLPAPVWIDLSHIAMTGILI